MGTKYTRRRVWGGRGLMIAGETVRNDVEDAMPGRTAAVAQRRRAHHGRERVGDTDRGVAEPPLAGDVGEEDETVGCVGRLVRLDHVDAITAAVTAKVLAGRAVVCDGIEKRTKKKKKKRQKKQGEKTGSRESEERAKRERREGEIKRRKTEREEGGRGCFGFVCLFICCRVRTKGFPE